MMPLPRVEQVLRLLNDFSLAEQTELYRELTPWLADMKLRSERATLQDMREARFTKGLQCPHCESTQVKRNGSFKDKKGYVKQRYLCKGCGSCMVEGLSVRKAAARLTIDKRTAFRWRHKLLSARHLLAPPYSVESSKLMKRTSRNPVRVCAGCWNGWAARPVSVGSELLSVDSAGN